MRVLFSQEYCPDRILSPEKLIPYDTEIQEYYLKKVWARIRDEILKVNPLLTELPDADTSAETIHTWMQENGGVLQGMSELDFRGLNLRWVPAELGLCTGLQTLNLAHNRILCLPEGLFDGMATLSTLYLNCNQLTFLSVTLLSRLTALKELELWSNQLTFLPEDLFHRLTSLKTLNFATNALSTVPVTLFRGLARLETLIVGNNPLASLPDRLFHGLNALNWLGLSQIQMESAPEGLFNGLAAMTWLDLSENRLTSLPESLFNGMPGLRSLILRENLLTSFPLTLFSRLTALQTLKLSRNQLTNLDELHFHGLNRLSDLDLHNNQLVFLPKLLIHNRFDHIDLRENPRLPYFYRNPAILFMTIPMMDAFFRYECQSPFAGFYQLAAESNSMQVIKEAFSGLDGSIKNAIFGMVWEEAGSPNTNNPTSWGGTHAFDEMCIFKGALKRYVIKTFDRLSNEERTAVYRHVSLLAQKKESADWGEKHAHDNILILIDAIMRQRSD